MVRLGAGTSQLLSPRYYVELHTRPVSSQMTGSTTSTSASWAGTAVRCYKHLRGGGREALEVFRKSEMIHSYLTM